MIVAGPAARRSFKTVEQHYDLVVVGGGLAGVCTAITAARAGIRVALVQDRPVLGGNASSEVRLWVLGATSHLGNNNRWSREGGVIDELLVENMYRNPEGNPIIFDTVILERVVAEPNITLLLNTAAIDVEKSADDAIASVRCFNSQNSTEYRLRAPLFCDASGDGVLGFLSGAAFRMGAESKNEFGEKFAPTSEYGELLGHTIYFYSKDVGRPVTYVPPAYALRDIRKIPRFRNFNAREYGCQLWWIEYGGRLDTVHDTESIKWELWRVVYGVWNHIKNSGQFPNADNLTLEWVGTIPGKRESRRFEGDYMLRQQDIVEQRSHPDAVSFGGWSIDLHPADGVFSEKPGCNQWHSKGVYQIPYRCMYSRNIANLFLAGRTISASHVAFGSSRVMATCAYGGQAVGMAAAICARKGLRPRDLLQADRIADLQRRLQRSGQHIPLINIADPDDLVASADVRVSSVLKLQELQASSANAAVPLNVTRAQLIPLPAGAVPTILLPVEYDGATELALELRTCSRPESFTPDVTLATRMVHLEPMTENQAVQMLAMPAAVGVSGGGGSSDFAATGVQAQRAAPLMREIGGPRGPTSRREIAVDFGVTLDRPCYAYVAAMANPSVRWLTSDVRVTGIVSVRHKGNDRVAEGATQTPPGDIGVDSFEFWCPERRPNGRTLAMKFSPALAGFDAANLRTGPDRPTSSANAWVASLDDAKPWVELTWPEPKRVGRVVVTCDADYDHPMESVLMGHPEREMPCCVPGIRLLDESGNVLGEIVDNHQTLVRFAFPAKELRTLRIELTRRSEQAPGSLFRVQAFAE
jgi:hypothetical protein